MATRRTASPSAAHRETAGPRRPTAPASSAIPVTVTKAPGWGSDGGTIRMRSHAPVEMRDAREYEHRSQPDACGCRPRVHRFKAERSSESGRENHPAHDEERNHDLTLPLIGPTIRHQPPAAALQRAG